jgi:hypothetical protein
VKSDPSPGYSRGSAATGRPPDGRRDPDGPQGSAGAAGSHAGHSLVGQPYCRAGFHSGARGSRTSRWRTASGTRGSSAGTGRRRPPVACPRGSPASGQAGPSDGILSMPTSLPPTGDCLSHLAPVGRLPAGASSLPTSLPPTGDCLSHLAPVGRLPAGASSLRSRSLSDSAPARLRRG